MDCNIYAPFNADNDAEPPSPGSLRVRPKREDAEKDPEAFYALLEWSRRHEKFSRQDLGKVLGDQTLNIESKMSRKIRERNFTVREQQAILQHLFSESPASVCNPRVRVRAETHALYFALLNFVQTPEAAQDDTRAAIIGTYRFWCYSAINPGEIVHGKLVFHEPVGARVVSVKMQQVRRGSGGSRDAYAEADGYFLKAGNAYLMLLNDPGDGAFRFTIFPRFHFGWVGAGSGGNYRGDPRSIFADRRRHLVLLDGHEVGMDGNRLFQSPIHLSLVDNVDELAELDRQLDVMPPDDPRIPRCVRQKLVYGGSPQNLCA